MLKTHLNDVEKLKLCNFIGSIKDNLKNRLEILKSRNASRYEELSDEFKEKVFIDLLLSITFTNHSFDEIIEYMDNYSFPYMQEESLLSTAETIYTRFINLLNKYLETKGIVQGTGLGFVDHNPKSETILYDMKDKVILELGEDYIFGGDYIILCAEEVIGETRDQYGNKWIATNAFNILNSITSNSFVYKCYNESDCVEPTNRNLYKCCEDMNVSCYGERYVFGEVAEVLSIVNNVFTLEKLEESLDKKRKRIDSWI